MSEEITASPRLKYPETDLPQQAGNEITEEVLCQVNEMLPSASPGEPSYPMTEAMLDVDPCPTSWLLLC